MHLVTYLAGRTPRLGAVWHDTGKRVFVKGGHKANR